MVRDAFDRRVRPVRRAERVVHVTIGEGGERCRELRVVLLFLRVKPQILEHHHPAAAGVRIDRRLAWRARRCSRRRR